MSKGEVKIILAPADRNSLDSLISDTEYLNGYRQAVSDILSTAKTITEDKLARLIASWSWKESCGDRLKDAEPLAQKILDYISGGVK